MVEGTPTISLRDSSSTWLAIVDISEIMDREEAIEETSEMPVVQHGLATWNDAQRSRRAFY